MKIIIKLALIFLLNFCMITISGADVGIGISDVGSISSVTGVENEYTTPAIYRLNQNYPNPFNPITIIEYQLPKLSQVDLSIYNLFGQKVAILVNKKQTAGIYQIEWDAKDFSSGVYYYYINAGSFSKTKKLVLLK